MKFGCGPRTHQCATDSKMTLWQCANPVRAAGASPIILFRLPNVFVILSSVMVIRIAIVIHPKNCDYGVCGLVSRSRATEKYLPPCSTGSAVQTLNPSSSLNNFSGLWVFSSMKSSFQLSHSSLQCHLCCDSSDLVVTCGAFGISSVVFRTQAVHSACCLQSSFRKLTIHSQSLPLRWSWHCFVHCRSLVSSFALVLTATFLLFDSATSFTVSS